MRTGRTVAAMNPQTGSRWTLANRGNRIALAVVLGLLAFATTRSIVLGLVIGGLTYLIATLFARPRDYAGKARQP